MNKGKIKFFHLLIWLAIVFSLAYFFRSIVLFSKVSDRERVYAAIKMTLIGRRAINGFYEKNGYLPIPEGDRLGKDILYPLNFVNDSDKLPIDPFDNSNENRETWTCEYPHGLVHDVKVSGPPLRYYVFSESTPKAIGVLGAVVSNGPDRDIDFTPDQIQKFDDIKDTVILEYDPSNGTISGGDIFRFIWKD